ncbi:MAG: DUF1761 domain-containing protein [Terriglobales bacterium]|jgi:hypothetical protein
MLLLFACFLFLVGIALILMLPALWAGQTYRSYRDGRTVNCPETHAPVSVRFHALRAAWSGLSSPPKLRLADCTRWPERADCGQECIPDAVAARPAAGVDHAAWRTRRVVHLPVLLAGAVAWVLGVAWHSQYLFRPRWAMAIGLSSPQALGLARTMAPHLLSVGACILFAYGVAGLLRWLGSRTLTHGLEVSAALWLATFAALLAATWSRLSPELLWIEAAYTFLAALLIGAIVGGVPRWIIMGDPEERGTRSRV